METDNKCNFVLEPCKIPKFVNLDILKKYVCGDLKNNLEYYEDTNSNYKISSSGKAEWISHKAISGSKMIGGGNSSYDIQINNKTFIDVGGLSLVNNYTNEKSIIQNFSGDLDILFREKMGDEAITLFKEKCWKNIRSIRMMIYILCYMFTVLKMYI